MFFCRYFRSREVATAKLTQRSWRKHTVTVARAKQPVGEPVTFGVPAHDNPPRALAGGADLALRAQLGNHSHTDGDHA
ncbi:hypothetical protein DSM43276_00098 [Mycobacteroides salmoniphilum]|nr:hypothetical protein DSM43276_00098 [Mycobacteroides salmoniphilum]